MSFERLSSSRRLKLILAMTGATGLPYALRAVEVLEPLVDLTLLCSDGFQRIVEYEWPLALSFDQWSERYEVQTRMDRWMASGSSPVDRYLVLPCSLNHLSRIALGLTDDLVARTIAVALKEKRSTVLVVREMPLSSIHLKHLLTLQRLPEVQAFVASPTFYNKPQTVADLVDTVVSRTIDLLQLGVPNPLRNPWLNDAY